MSDAPKKEYNEAPGPIQNRQCRDVFFLILFIVCWIAMFVVSGFAIQAGNVNRLKFGRDYLGNLCGDPNLNSPLKLEGQSFEFDFTNNKYVYYANLGIESDTTPICVNKCPSAATGGQLVDFLDSKYKQLPEANKVNFSVPVPYYDAKPTAFRCIPRSGPKVNFTEFGVTPLFGDDEDDLEKEGSETATKEKSNVDAMSQIWDSVTDNVGYIALSLLIGTGLSLLWLISVSYFGKVMVWATLVLTNVAFFALGGFFIGNWQASRSGSDLKYNNERLTTVAQNQRVMLASGVICLVLAFGFLGITIFLRKRIRLALELMGQASLALRALPALILVPTVKYVILIGVFSWSLFIMAMLSTAGTESIEGNVKKYEPDTVLNYMQLFYLFGSFWTFNLILAIAETITAGAVAQWYWTKDKSQLPAGTVLQSAYRVFRYHLGSLALGALIIAILQTVRAVIQYIQTQSKTSPNIWVKRLMSCVACCLYCFEKVLKFLNTNAYIEIAIYGYSFFDGAKEAFHLLWRNAVRAVVVSGVGEFVIFLGKALITGTTCFIAFGLLNRSLDEESDEEASKGFFMMVLLFVALGTWFIASLFTSILKLATQTVFLSLLEDGERHDGSADKPYYAPQELMEFIDTKGSQAMAEV